MWSVRRSQSSSADTAEACDQKAPGMAADRAHPVVLLVEADEPLGQVITAYLQRDGCRVVRVTGLEDAADAVSACPLTPAPDLMIVDLDHLDVRSSITNIDALTSLPVLLLASSPVPPRGMRRPDAVPLLPKPFTMHDLRQQVGSALRLGGGAP
jgi:DNA-binding response OmpR family regulator